MTDSLPSYLQSAESSSEKDTERSDDNQSGQSSSLLQEEREARKQRLLARQEAARERKKQMDAEKNTQSSTAKEDESSTQATTPSSSSEAKADKEESQTIREDMVANAVKFLMHESVQSTPLVRRVAFLENKGLTSKEITVALQRVAGGSSATETIAAPPTASKTARARKVQEEEEEEEDDDEEEYEKVSRRRVKVVQAPAPQIIFAQPPVPAPAPVPSPPVRPVTRTTSWKTVASRLFLVLGAASGLLVLFRNHLPLFMRKWIGGEDRKDKQQSQAGIRPPQSPAPNSLEYQTGYYSPYITPGAVPPIPYSYPSAPINQVEQLRDQVTELVRAVKSQEAAITRLSTPLPDTTNALSLQQKQRNHDIDVRELKATIQELQTLLKSEITTSRKESASTTSFPPQSSGASQNQTPSISSQTISSPSSSPYSTPLQAQTQSRSSQTTTHTHSTKSLYHPSTPSTTTTTTSTTTSSPGTPNPLTQSTPNSTSDGMYSQNFMDVVRKVQRGEIAVKDVDDRPLSDSPSVEPSTNTVPQKPWEKRLGAKKSSVATGGPPLPSYLTSSSPAVISSSSSSSQSDPLTSSYPPKEATPSKIEVIEDEEQQSPKDEEDDPIETKNESPERL